jgi:hypothetical protein
MCVHQRGGKREGVGAERTSKLGVGERIPNVRTALYFSQTT